MKGGDLYLLDLASNKERRLTTGGSARLTNGLAEFVAQEEMGRYDGSWWSPDSKLIAYEEADTRGVETFTLGDPMHPRSPLKGVYHLVKDVQHTESALDLGVCTHAADTS